MLKAQLICLSMFALMVPFIATSDAVAQQQDPYAIQPPTAEQAEYYGLDTDFYQKTILVQDILIATSGRVSDYALKESAYLFDKIMRSIDPEVAQRVRDQKLLCLLIGWDENTSDLPQYRTDKTGEDLDYYNWRRRGFLGSQRIDGRRQPVVVFAEEDVLEYPGGMQNESILIHEFGHVIMFQGFNEAQMKQVTACYENAKEKGLYNDGFAGHFYKWVQGIKPVKLLDHLAKQYPEVPRALIYKCLENGDITVNGRASTPHIMVSETDKVIIHFGGPKDCYAIKNRAEYYAEIVQAWYDTNRTMDHDHNHIHTREQLQAYDPMGAKLCAQTLGEGDWRFVSPRLRAGTGHLKGYDPEAAPTMTQAPNIEEAGMAYYDEYWASYWERLQKKYPDAK